MQLYTTKLLFEIKIEGIDDAQFDEEFALITASGIHEAYIKASEKGKSESQKFTNNNGKQVSWVFLGISGLSPVPSSKDVIVCHTKSYEPDNADLFKKSMMLKIEKVISSLETIVV